MKITLIRHTKVDVPQGIIYGQSDVGLQQTFTEEAAEIGKKLNGKTFNRFYSSPLTRCKKLAQHLFESEQIQFDPRLQEIKLSDWEGKKMGVKCTK